MSHDITILDGGLSRELIRLNAPFRQPEWSALALIETPHLVQQAHENFAAAGAMVLTTNSYALVPFHIGLERFEGDGAQLAGLAGRVAREAVSKCSKEDRVPRQVAGSLPPLFGSYEPDSFRPDLAPRYLSILIDGLTPYVDIWLGETLSLIAEAEAVMTALQHSPKPKWISFTLADSEEALRQPHPTLRSGELVSNAARWALTRQIDALLFNCSRPESIGAAIEVVQHIFRAEGKGFRLPKIGAYANAFEERSGMHRANEEIVGTRGDLTGEVYGGFVREWVEKGASIVGGCCGVGLLHIRTIARELLR